LGPEYALNARVTVVANLTVTTSRYLPRLCIYRSKHTLPRSRLGPG
jgi:hypothetical protein